MAREQPAGLGEPLHHLEHARRQAGLEENFLQLDGRERRQLGGFENHGIAAGERRRRLPAGNLQRIIPSADAGYHAQRFAPRVAEGLRIRDRCARRSRIARAPRNTPGSRRRTRHRPPASLGWACRCRAIRVRRARDCANATARPCGAGCARARCPSCAAHVAWPRCAAPDCGIDFGRARHPSHSPARSPVAGLKDAKRSPVRRAHCRRLVRGDAVPHAGRAMPRRRPTPAVRCRFEPSIHEFGQQRPRAVRCPPRAIRTAPRAATPHRSSRRSWPPGFALRPAERASSANCADW